MTSFAPGGADHTGGTTCVPSPVLSSGPRGIVLVGQSGSPDPIGAVTHVVRDAGGVPVPGSTIGIDFSHCPDLQIGGDVLSPNVHVNCAARTVWTVTDAAGTATFSIVGGGTGGTAGLVTRCASVTVDGVPLPSPIVSVFDLDGRNGVDAMDLCIFAADLFSGQYRQRCDYDADGDVDGIDLSLLARALFGGGSSTSGKACMP